MPFSPVVAGLWRQHEWGLDRAALGRWIEQALDLGISTFDHADLYGHYGNEAAFGAAMAAVPGLRERAQLVTKCGIRLVSPARPAHTIKSYDSSRTHIVASVEASLAALRTDRIDLLLIHRPDLLAEPDEMAEAFQLLRRAGKVLHFGVSNHSTRQFEALHRRVPLVTHQIEFNALQMQALADGTLEQALDLGLQPMIWSPLAGGRLFTATDAQAERVRAALVQLAQRHGVSVAAAAYAWVLRHPARPLPITGTGRVQGLRDAVAGLSLRLTREEWTLVWQASMGRELA